MFKKQLLQKEEEEFSKLTLAPEQRQIVTALGNVLVKFIDIPLAPTLGFIWRSIKDWQVENKRSISELSTSSVDDRVNSVHKMTENLKGYLKKVLKSPSDEQKIDEGVDKMFAFYKSQFSTR